MGGEGLTGCEVDNHRCRLEWLFDSINDDANPDESRLS